MNPSVTKPVRSAIPGASAARVACLQRGLSLIELMISITIGLLILAALSTLFVNQSRTRTELDKSNRMIDNGRYAMELLADNLSVAGFYGDFEPASGVPPVPAALPDPCTTNAAGISAALQLAMQGYNAAGQTSQIASLPCAGFTYSTDSDLSVKAGSDIVAIRRASTATPVAVGAALAGRHYIQASRCQNDAVSYVLSTNPAAFVLRECKLAGTTLTDLRDFMVEIYYVAPHNTVGDSIPTLKRYELDPTTHEFLVRRLVEGIEYMQVDYGRDTDNDGDPDNYTDAPALADWPSVVTVRMNILARNTEESPGYNDTKVYNLGLAGNFGPFNDKFKRHVYTRHIRLNNVAGRRE